MRFLIKRLGPWGWLLMLGQAAMVTRRHWQQTDAADRARLATLVRDTGVRPDRMSAAQRQEVLQIARRMRPGRLLVDLVMGVIRPGRRARRA